MSEAKPRKPRKSRARRVLKRVGQVLGAVVGLLLALVLFLHTGPGQRLLRSRVEKALGGLVNGTAELRGFRLSLFSGELGIEGLVFRDVAGREAVAVDALDGKLSFLSIVRGTPEVERIAIRGVRLHVVEGSDGKTNLSTLFKPRERKTPDRITVKSFALEKVGVLVERADGGVTRVKDVTLNATL